ncbi:hypothetical protein EGT67_03620 [Prescottella agglutinans]|uniref:Uncharacterized protein n=1 Tax=Prescottella agglutinans TaxID=1644129 RepID=A0A438BKM0_9NOCA|nr:hypothetical protein [Prescottella agglutinans]RVW11506.1 hypothetical protein EGT67_03620 [Prescottella agglutinans]
MTEPAQLSVPSPPTPPASPLSGLTRQQRLEYLRRRIAAVPARGEAVSRDGAGAGDIAERMLPVPGPLATLLPRGGLPRGSVVSVSGAASLLLGLLAAVTEAGGHAAVIGHPRLGVLAATEMGAQLRRLAFVPDPGPDPVEVAAVLLDGMDLVVLGLGGISVPPSRARAVVARARSKQSTLVVTDGHWGGAEVRLDARVHGYDGVGRGASAGRGRLCSVRLSVRAQGRAFQPRTARLDVRSSCGRVEWVPEAVALIPDAVAR